MVHATYTIALVSLVVNAATSYALPLRYIPISSALEAKHTHVNTTLIAEGRVEWREISLAP